MRSPRASISDHASSENGRVTRGASAMRETVISKPNSTSAGPARPAIGAAVR